MIEKNKKYFDRYSKFANHWVNKPKKEIFSRFKDHCNVCKKGCCIYDEKDGVIDANFELTCFTGAVLFDSIVNTLSRE